jgi:hypothetical protein
MAANNTKNIKLNINQNININQKNETKGIPKIVFIIPYRNRIQHKFFFSTYLTSILSLSEYKDSYEIYFSHQCDKRSFNRGATKNIGFLAVKKKYPDHYKDITLVFNDIDTIPFSNIFNYETIPGEVKHFYGFEYALGGIVAINAGDFEMINGYPSFWGWGLEDSVLQKRCLEANLTINRDQFYPIGSPDILHLFDGVSRLINRKDPIRANNDNGLDGHMSIGNLYYTIDSESRHPLDNIHVVTSDKIFFINIVSFTTGTKFENKNFYKYDLRTDPKEIIDNANTNQTKEIDVGLTDNNNEWTKIPYIPDAEAKNELISQYGENVAAQIIEYSYENSVDPNKPVIPPHIQNYTHIRRNQPNQINTNKYSPAYAGIIGSKPRATASANIRLGGVYRK